MCGLELKRKLGEGKTHSKFAMSQLQLLLQSSVRKHGSIGKNDSNREMNLRAKPNVMHESSHKSSRVRQNERSNNVIRMVITKARAMTFGLGGKLKHLFIFYALFSLFIYALLYKVIKFR